MENGTIITKCCICGRIKTGDAWEFRGDQDESACSHGFCSICYEAEIKKIKLQAAFPAVMLYQ